MCPISCPASPSACSAACAPRFGAGGQIVLDVVGTTFIRIQALNFPISRTGARMHYSLDEPQALADAVGAGLVVRDAFHVWQAPGRENIPWFLRLSLWFYSWFPGLSKLTTYVRYQF